MNKNESDTGMWLPVDGDGAYPEAIRREGAWVPRPLRSDIIVCSLVHKAMAAAEQAIGRLDEAAERLPDRQQLVYYTMLREARSSAALENSFLSLTEVLQAGLPGMTGGPELEPILRYLTAGQEAFRAVRDGADIGLDLLGKISQQLSPGHGDAESDAEFWRTEPSWVGGRSPESAVLMHTPPGPHLHAATSQLQEWIQSPCNLPLVGKLAMGHHRLELIHPFAGGNGYVSRLYVSLELVRAKALRDQILPLSIWLDRKRDEYHARLREVVVTGSFEGFMTFFAEGIQELCLEQIDLIGKLEELRENHLEKVGRGGNLSRVASGLIVMPVTNHAEIARRFDISYKGATDIARQLERLGLLTVRNNAKYKKVFICQPVLDVLSSHDPVPPASDRAVFSTSASNSEP